MSNVVPIVSPFVARLEALPPVNLACFMAIALADKPHLNLDRIEQPWLYLHHECGFEHDQLHEHIDEAIRIVRRQQEARP